MCAAFRSFLCHDTSPSGSHGRKLAAGGLNRRRVGWRIAIHAADSGIVMRLLKPGVVLPATDARVDKETKAQVLYSDPPSA